MVETPPYIICYGHMNEGLLLFESDSALVEVENYYDITAFPVRNAPATLARNRCCTLIYIVLESNL